MEEEEYWEWTKGEIDLTNHILEFTQPITRQTFSTFFKPKLDMLGLLITPLQSDESIDYGMVHFVYIGSGSPVRSGTTYVLSFDSIYEQMDILNNIGWEPSDKFNANEIFNLHCI